METLFEQENVLNVTLLEPRLKHPTIFVRFDELHQGETLTIHNDHDPKPLYYQLLGERGNIFNWEYLEEGPEWWKVKIKKNRQETMMKPLARLQQKIYAKLKCSKNMAWIFVAEERRL